MPGSDIMIGWVDDDGEVYLQDRYTTSKAVPILDPHQNLTLISGEESDGMTRIRFKRPKYTCNENDIQSSQGTTRYDKTNIILFWHKQKCSLRIQNKLHAFPYIKPFKHRKKQCFLKPGFRIEIV